MGELLRHFKGKFLPGLALIAPVGVTVFVLRALLSWADEILAPVVRRWFGVDVFGVGLLATLGVIYLAGLLATNVFGRKLVQILEGLLARLPMVKMIYGGTKQVLAVISRGSNTHGSRVVFVEYPRRGIKALAFVTGETRDPQTSEVLCTLFVPSSPSPLTGYTMFVSPDQTEESSLTFEEAVQLIVSGGIVMPGGAKALREAAHSGRQSSVPSAEDPSSQDPALVHTEPGEER